MRRIRGDHVMNDLVQPPARIRNIAELARLAGVSAGTVSRALANSDLVNQETKERIQALAREHGFRPNQMARRLRVQQTKVIGIVVPLGHDKRQHLSDPFFMAMLGHLADALTENGYDIMLSRVVPEEDDWLERIVDSGMLDGVLLIGQSNQFDVIERVAAWYKPMVVWGSHRAGQVHCTVGVDNRLGGKLAGECLIAAGRKRLAFIGNLPAPEFVDRYQGLCDAAQAAGLEQPLSLNVHLAADTLPDEVARQVEQIVGKVDGLAAGSDMIAVQAVRALTDRGFAVPDQVAVTGFDDLPLAEHTIPRLTTVRQDLALGAQTMVELLFQRMAGSEPESVEMKPLLVRRETA